jgi:hypothetical protein
MVPEDESKESGVDPSPSVYFNLVIDCCFVLGNIVGKSGRHDIFSTTGDHYECRRSWSGSSELIVDKEM